MTRLRRLLTRSWTRCPDPLHTACVVVGIGLVSAAVGAAIYVELVR